VYDAEFMVSGRTVKAIEAERSAAAAAEEISRGPTPVDYRAAKALLGETFGTRKAKQALNSATKNQINIDQLESNAASFINRNLDKSLDRMASAAEADGATIPGGQVSHDSMGILPPFNSTTTKVEQIYQVKTIVPEAIWAALPVGDFSASSSESWESLQKRYQMCDYVLDRIRNMLEDGGSNYSEERLRALLYLHLLFKLRETKEGILNNETGLQKAFPEASPAVLAHLLETFTESLVLGGKIKRKLSALSKDRLLSHLCILTLLVDGFRVNLTLMSTLLKIPVTKMTDHFRAVGCAIEKPGKGEVATFTAPGTTRALQVKFALLKAPITFPKPKRGPQK
jgi:DNA-directed RNA polymerase I subunit RPA49